MRVHTMKKFFASAAVFLAALTWLTGLTGLARAQGQPDDVVFVQLEAHPSLATAQTRARLFSEGLEDVNGFTLGGGWYGIAIGPYRRGDATQILQSFRASGRIPSDAYIAEARAYGNQFWPVGANVLGRGTVVEPADTGVSTGASDGVRLTTAPEPADETPAEARRSERALTRDERKDLQIALQAAGYYSSAIDGAFGPGTRRSMSDWQSANGFEVTGVLTTKQRKVLLDQYNAPLISVGMTAHADRDAGIAMQMPMAAIKFSRYEPPFAHYNAATADGIRVLLISQPGDQKTLFGLYDIMQTLEIVPLEGPRERRKTDFTIEGRNSRIVSYTEVALDDGQIKGFTLIWPTGDEARRTRVLALMRKSFERLDGVLDPASGADALQSVDLVSGLEIRKPRLSRSGFYVDTAGTVVTTAEVVNGCTRVTLDGGYRADVAGVDANLGVAVLRPSDRLAPPAVASFRQSSPRLQSDVTLAGYSFEGKLGAPTLTFGKLEDVQGLQGEPELARLAMSAEDGDAGGPVMDASGAVVGMLLPEGGGARQLPAGVRFALNGAAIGGVLGGLGLSPSSAEVRASATPDDLLRMGSDMTVLVSCWD